MLNRDLEYVDRIIEHCNYIEIIINDVNNDYERFNCDFKSQQSVSFNILQIGEIVKRLSEQLKAEYDNIEWNKIYAMRNLVVHDYGSLDYSMVFETARRDIPELKKQCQECFLEVLARDF